MRRIDKVVIIRNKIMEPMMIPISAQDNESLVLEEKKKREFKR